MTDKIKYNTGDTIVDKYLNKGVIVNKWKDIENRDTYQIVFEPKIEIMREDDVYALKSNSKAATGLEDDLIFITNGLEIIKWTSKWADFEPIKKSAEEFLKNYNEFLSKKTK